MICSNSLFAQNESGVRNICKNARIATGEWYDSTNAMFQVKFPIIRSIPPINTGMPTNILLYYIYLDSLLRFTSYAQTTDIIDNFSTLNDTLKGAASVLYQLTDYDPILFAQYSAEVSHYQRRDISSTRKTHGIFKNGYRTDTVTVNYPKFPRYLNSLIILAGETALKTFKLLPDSLSHSIFTMLYADYILKIKVLDIDSTPNLLIHNVAYRDYRYRVTALVTDTLKGKVFKSINNVNPNIISDELQKAPPVIIQFEFQKQNYSPGATIYKNKAQNQYMVEDPAFLRDYAFFLNVNQEAVVFLKYHNLKVDFENDYMNLDICPQCSYCALPIIDGNIRDINNFWSGNTILSYENWKIIYNQLKNKIISLDY